jgi:hypothetical protein
VVRGGNGKAEGEGRGWSFFWGVAKMRVSEGWIIENDKKSKFFSRAFSLVNHDYFKTTRL